ncbi:hypothetical protein AL073_00265 [Loktanella sp. 1ANDIMAR09]|uniref:DUF3329 domain-containing protein n=1 Tax=Yoonia rosea TaxID=287098 RepID=A0A1R3W9I2_9RHOB|nr:hypothetical protein AL073_00265 [Loktanella sp. 1ANDIMAR09]SIT74414.1 hypothetical protein SAMN05421665_0045 [Yoonia rosea]
MIDFLGLHHPFFRPLARRIATVAVIAIYGLFELVFGGPAWAVFAACLGLICIYAFFIKPDPQA